jgi:hypothetical protein
MHEVAYVQCTGQCATLNKIPVYVGDEKDH